MDVPRLPTCLTLFAISALVSNPKTKCRIGRGGSFGAAPSLLRA